MTSCHHGHARYENNLYHAIRVMNTQTEIKVMGIDFIHVGDDFVSSHDYSTENIENGASLGEWVEEVIIRRDKILWLDLKSHVDPIAIMCVCCDMRFKFDCRHLFKVLATLCNKTKRRLQDKIWLSCQDKEVRDSLVRFNTRLKGSLRWNVVTDIPFVNNYACKYLNDWLPINAYALIYSYVVSYFLEYDFTDASTGFTDLVVCIDQCFFPCDSTLTKFIEESSIPPGATILLYTYERTHPSIRIMGYNIIMQYDYTTAQRRRRPLPQICDNKIHSL